MNDIFCFRFLFFEKFNFCEIFDDLFDKLSRLNKDKIEKLENCWIFIVDIIEDFLDGELCFGFIEGVFLYKNGMFCDFLGCFIEFDEIFRFIRLLILKFSK